jgi:hypothetical protein
MTAGRLIPPAADALVREPERAHLRRIEQVAAVDEHLARHPLAGRGPVELAQLGPLGHDHGGVRSVERPERRVGDLHPVDEASVRDGVPRAHVRPFGEQPSGEHEARGLAHVVRARLEREAEERDPLAAQRPEVSLQLADHAPLLELVDLDHGVQELEAVARVRGELLERERVLWETVR